MQLKVNDYCLISLLLTLFIHSSLANYGNNGTNSYKQQTLIMVKPDGVQRGLIGEVIKRFEAKGLKLVGMKYLWAPKELIEKHYEHLKSEWFFNGLVEYMTSGPVIPMVWEGYNSVAFGRSIIGDTNPSISVRGTIRGDFCQSQGLTVVHGSHSREEAEKEVKLWFTEKEKVQWKQSLADWII